MHYRYSGAVIRVIECASFFFFFQAEDGIRDLTVTGVQTCALPISDGTLEQLLLSSEPLGVIAAAKALAHWLVSGLPLVLIAPLIALQYDLAAPLYPVLALSLLLGTPVLSLIGAIGAALTLGLRGGGALLSLLVLPLYVPVLIMGAGSVDMAAAGLAPDGQLLLLAALLIFAAAFAPWATAAALRLSGE